MKKNGFTLVELLVVVVILALITTMGSVGLGSLKRIINNNLWNGNKDLIENAAKRYCDDKKSQILKYDEVDGTCKIDNKDIKPCITIKVQDLLDKKYIISKEKIKRDNKEIKVIINQTVDKSNNENDNFNNGYYVNEKNVYIYIENNVCYSKYVE